MVENERVLALIYSRFRVEAHVKGSEKLEERRVLSTLIVKKPVSQVCTPSVSLPFV